MSIAENYKGRSLAQRIRADMRVQEAKSAPAVQRAGKNRNQLCPCGSGVKFKKCCLRR